MAELEANDKPRDPRGGATERLMSWMIGQGLHIGDARSFDDLLQELGWQLQEFRERGRR